MNFFIEQIGVTGISLSYFVLIILALFIIFCITIRSTFIGVSIMIIGLCFAIIFYLSIPFIMGWATTMPIPKEPVPLLQVSKNNPNKQKQKLNNEEKEQQSDNSQIEQSGEVPKGQVGRKPLTTKTKEKTYILLELEDGPRLYERSYDEKEYEKLKDAIEKAEQEGKWIYLMQREKNESESESEKNEELQIQKNNDEQQSGAGIFGREIIENNYDYGSSNTFYDRKRTELEIIMKEPNEVVRKNK